MTEQTLTLAESLQASISALEGLAETRSQIAILQAEINRLTLMLEYKQPRLELAQTAISYAIVLNERTSTYSGLIEQVNQIVQLDIPENLEEYIYATLANLFELLFYLRKDFINNNNQFNSLLNNSGELRANLTKLQPLFQVNTQVVMNDIILFVTEREDNFISVVSLISYLFAKQRIDNPYNYLINQMTITYYSIPYLTSLANLITQSSELLAELMEPSETTFINNNHIFRIEDIMTILHPYTPDWEPQIIQNSPPLRLNNVYELAIEEQSTRLNLIEQFYALVNEIISGMDTDLDHVYNQVVLAIAYTINP